jgi:prepilin-type processing-associated H-X9-DG protein
LLALLIFLAGTAVGAFLVGQGVGFVREAHEQEECAGQLKVIAMAMRMYALDNNALPPGDNWRAALEARGVSRQTWSCPARRDGLPYPLAPHLDLHRLQAGDRTLALAADAPLANGHGPHQGKFNVVYADGHVEQATSSPLPGGKGSVVTMLPGLL